jgi:hypothetical protein
MGFVIPPMIPKAVLDQMTPEERQRAFDDYRALLDRASESNQESLRFGLAVFLVGALLALALACSGCTFCRHCHTIERCYPRDGLPPVCGPIEVCE